jgi:hypothetical protein
MLTQQPDIADTSPRSFNPIGERRETLALITALKIWLLALLAPLLGARAARAWVASILPAACEEEPSECTEAEIRLLRPFLWLLGPGPNRGMRPHARTAPLLPPAHARDPPLA